MRRCGHKERKGHNGSERRPTDARAKNVKPQQWIDRNYLDEMQKSGFAESLRGTRANKKLIVKN